MKIKKPLERWGRTRFEYSRQDVATCVTIIENNKHRRDIACIFDVMQHEFQDKKPRDASMLLSWVEQIHHLHSGNVQDIPGFLCDTNNPYRWPGKFRIFGK